MGLTRMLPSLDTGHMDNLVQRVAASCIGASGTWGNQVGMNKAAFLGLDSQTSVLMAERD